MKDNMKTLDIKDIDETIKLRWKIKVGDITPFTRLLVVDEPRGQEAPND